MVGLLSSIIFLYRIIGEVNGTPLEALIKAKVPVKVKITQKQVGYIVYGR